jgi:endonuclease-3
MKSPAATQRVVDALAGLYPGADTELHYRTAFELLVATMLSAQSTDARVNMVTPALFARYPDARALAAATPAELEPQILSTGFFRQKAKALVTMAGILVREHDGEVPAEMAALTTLPGVGRKTANVVLGHALGIPGLPVDRHVLRVANRIGIAEGEDPVAVEQQLCDRLPPAMWTLASDVQILHGRRVCRPTRPLCEQCPVADVCDYFAILQREAREAAPARKPRTTAKPAAARKTRARAKPPRRGKS